MTREGKSWAVCHRIKGTKKKRIGGALLAVGEVARNGVEICMKNETN